MALPGGNGGGGSRGGDTGDLTLAREISDQFSSLSFGGSNVTGEYGRSRIVQMRLKAIFCKNSWVEVQSTDGR